MKILCAFGQYQYGRQSLGIGTEYAAFIPAFRELGHEVYHVETWGENSGDLIQINRRVLEAAERVRPDVLFTVHILYEIWSETVAAIRGRYGTIAITWTTDDSWKYGKVSRYIGHNYDCITTTYDYVVPKYHRDGLNNVALTQWAARRDALSVPLRAEECDINVSFVGAAHGYRPAAIRQLGQLGIDVACFGYGWANGPVSEQELYAIMRRSFISLNFANSKGVNQIKARTFEIPGAGGFLLTEDAPGLERFFRIGEEIDIFRDIENLAEKIEFYQQNPGMRDALAKAGHDRAARDHLYANRMADILAFAMSTRVARRSAEVVNVGQVSLSAGRWMPWFGKRLVAIAGIFVGRKRARKYVHRIIFELSIRLLPHATFSRGGIPGRMFPNPQFGP